MRLLLNTFLPKLIPDAPTDIASEATCNDLSTDTLQPPAIITGLPQAALITSLKDSVSPV